jgi:hypothetical protein
MGRSDTAGREDISVAMPERIERIDDGGLLVTDHPHFPQIDTERYLVENEIGPWGCASSACVLRSSRRRSPSATRAEWRARADRRRLAPQKPWRYPDRILSPITRSAEVTASLEAGELAVVMIICERCEGARTMRDDAAYLAARVSSESSCVPPTIKGHYLAHNQIAGHDESRPTTL